MNYINHLGELGIKLCNEADLDGSLKCFHEILSLDPHSQQALLNIGIIYAQKDQHQDALHWLQQSLAIRPSVPALVTAGLAAMRVGLLDTAREYFRHAVELNPLAADARANLSNSLLLDGQYTAGWEEFEWRHAVFRYYHGQSKEEFYGLPPRRRWHGDPVDHLLIHYEQGLGDTIQSLRYVRPATKRCKKTSLVVQSTLRNIVQYSFNDDPNIIVCEKIPQEFNEYIWIDGLPRIFGAGINPIPNQPYLRVPPRTQELLPHTRPQIGLVWSGSRGFSGDKYRSVPFDLITTLFTCDVDFISLQKDSQETHECLFDASPYLTDWMDTAWAISTLDLIISVDTSVVHMAGALGKPVWLLNRYDSCWRWLLHTEHSPWYPSATIFRQPSPGDWDSVIHQVRNRLNSLDII